MIEVGLAIAYQYGTMPVIRADVTYGLLYFPTNGLRAMILATFPGTFSDTYGGIIKTT